MAKIIRPLKGTRDFYPEQMFIRSWLYESIRKVSESFGYQEYEGPFLESIELYSAKSGDELVKEQSFVFPDRSGDLITLRPELTPTLVRMVAQRQNQLVFPLRWWSFGPFWRYERPQKGRSREFFQWNADLIGVDSPEADTELVALMASFFKIVGLTPDEVIILINNRRLMDQELHRFGIPADQRNNVFKIIDRRDKLSHEDWLQYAFEEDLSNNQVTALENLIENKNLWKESNELTRFFSAVDALNVSEYVQFAPHIIRGLDYYTGTVFEARTTNPDIRRAILGGGRYDNLMADVGGSPLPGVGFAMGDMVINLVLEAFGHLPDKSALLQTNVLVTVFDSVHLLPAYKLASKLRQAGLKVTCYPVPAKLGKQLKYADRIGARIAVIMGPDEHAQGNVTIKDLRDRTQKTLPISEATHAIHIILAEDLPS